MKLNKMLVLTAISAGTMVASGSAFSKDTSGASPMGANTTSKTSQWSGEGRSGSAAADKMSQKLGLSDSQKEKVKSLFGQTHEQMTKVKENTSLTTDEKKSQMRAIREKMDTKMKSILTPEQYQKWQKITEQHLSMPHGMQTPPSTMPNGSPPR